MDGSARAGRLHEFEALTRFPGSADDVWNVVSDHDLYGRLAPNLSRVAATSSDGPSLTRRCWDRSGKHWDEVCTDWEAGRGFAVEVDTSASDYPYPLSEMRGEWRLEDSDATETTVRIRFAYRAERSPRGAAFAAMMRVAMGPSVRRITRGWRRELERRAAGAPERGAPRSA